MTAQTLFGKYLLLDRINVGGMAEVFKAKTFGIEGFERIVAIKRILPNMADDQEFIHMFVDEARIAVQLSHANIVQIYELGKIEEQYYIAMEYVSGKDLRQILDRYRKKDKTLPIPAAAYITSRLCEGLDYAHRKVEPSGRALNVIHRDVSPQNILVSFEGAVKITDFGIAKAEDRASKTQAGVLKGKFGYMSPEQVRGLEIDHRSDIFAVGILLYEMCTGKRLFIGESDFSTLERVRKAEVVPPTEHNPDLSPEFEQVVLRALARERDERYQWASELLDDLQQFTIDGNTIYNAKRLSALLREDYQADLDAEMQRMEEYMRLPAPPSLIGEASRSSGSNLPADSTMIFESDFGDLENAPTEIGEAVASNKVSRIEQMQTGSLVVPLRPSSPSPPTSAPAPRSTAGNASGPSTIAVWIVALFFVIFTGVLAYVVLSGPAPGGTLMVTTSPVSDNVEIVLNNEVVATRTPFDKEGLEPGTYRLEARAVGFASKIYKVNIVDGAEAVVKVEFDVPVARRDGIARISSVPEGGSVFRDGEKVGITPFEMTGLRTDQTLTVSIRLDGYEDVVLRGDFSPGNPVLELSAQLVERETTKLNVVSRPSGASLSLDGRELGKTPYSIEGLDPARTYRLELTLDGFKNARVDYQFGEQLIATKTVVLERKKPLSVTKDPGERTPNGGKKNRPGRCTGNDALFSVMVVGEPSCSITIGSNATFRSPMFKQAVPSGRCPIVATCPSGKRYSETRTLKSGDNGKLIITPAMME